MAKRVVRVLFHLNAKYRKKAKRWGVDRIWTEKSVRRTTYPSTCGCRVVFRVIFEELPDEWQEYLIARGQLYGLFVCRCYGTPKLAKRVR